MRFEIILALLVQLGATVYPDVDFDGAQLLVKNGLRGVFATRNLPAGSTVFKSHRKDVFTFKECQGDSSSFISAFSKTELQRVKDAKIHPEARDQVLDVLCLMDLRARPSAFRFKKYAELLLEPDVPLLWPKRTLWGTLQRMQNTTSQYLESLFGGISAALVVKAKAFAETFTVHDLSIAYALYMSRCLLTSWSASNVIVPGADMFNHADQPNAIKVDTAEAVSISLSRPVQAGEEITINYFVERAGNAVSSTFQFGFFDLSLHTHIPLHVDDNEAACLKKDSIEVSLESDVESLLERFVSEGLAVTSTEAFQCLQASLLSQVRSIPKKVKRGKALAKAERAILKKLLTDLKRERGQFEL